MDFPLNLKQRLRENKVIPFVGAGVSMAVRKKGTSESLFPSWKQLLERAADCLEGELKAQDAGLVRAYLQIDNPKYLEAAEHARQALGSILYDVLKAQIDKSCSEAEDESLNLARAIWGLGNFIITTNYDRVLQYKLKPAA